MKVHHSTRGRTYWSDHEPASAGLTLEFCKRLRPLAPKVTSHDDTDSCFTINNYSSSISSSSSSNNGHLAFDLKSFIRPESSPIRLVSSDHKKDSPQVETHPGGTRWNPTQEQIGILEMLYRGGMRTPNAQQIEQITSQLGKYGKIEGKNVFYWFQNHKARERQKQKRNNINLGLMHSPSSTVVNSISLSPKGEGVESPYKRKCRNWGFERLDLEEEDDEKDNKTLELFPLHPEGISRSS